MTYFRFQTPHFIILLSENFLEKAMKDEKCYEDGGRYGNMDGWTDRDILEGVKTLIDELNDMEGDPLVLVEGKKDLMALGAIGVKVPAMALNQGMELFDLLDSISPTDTVPRSKKDQKRIVILTDWDRKGGQLASRIGKACSHLGIPHDTEIRRKLAQLTGKYIRTVESLGSLMERLERST
jgi:dTMP kinase